jgi:predicted RNase H-like nuclease (RuvC/YqgF family)
MESLKEEMYQVKIEKQKTEAKFGNEIESFYKTVNANMEVIEALTKDKILLEAKLTELNPVEAKAIIEKLAFNKKECDVSSAAKRNEDAKYISQYVLKLEKEIAELKASLDLLPVDSAYAESPRATLNDKRRIEYLEKEIESFGSVVQEKDDEISELKRKVESLSIQIRAHSNTLMYAAAKSSNITIETLNASVKNALDVSNILESRLKQILTITKQEWVYSCF